MTNITQVNLTGGVPTGPAGAATVSTIDALMADGGQVTIGLTTAAAVVTDATGTLQQYLRGLVKLIAAGISVTISNANANGQAAMAASAPVTIANNQSDLPIKPGSTETAATGVTIGTSGVGYLGWLSSIAKLLSGTLTTAIAPSTTDVAVVPTVTASAYTAGNVIGGIMTFASILAATSFNGVLQSITAKFKGAAVTGSLEVAIFKASPSNGTYADKTAPTWNAADMVNLLGIYTLSTPNSKLGTMTVYNLDGIGKALAGASTSLFAVVVVDGTPSPASTSDFTLELSVLPG